MRESIALLLEKIVDWLRSGEGIDVPFGLTESNLEPAGTLRGDGVPLTSARHTDYVDTDGRPIHECPMPTAKAVVDAIMDRPIEFVDWKSLPHEARLRWSNDARLVLTNPAFISICGKMIDQAKKTNGELVKILIESGTRYSKDFQQLQDVRMTINGIELVREELEKMLYREQPESTEDLNAAV